LSEIKDDMSVSNDEKESASSIDETKWQRTIDPQTTTVRFQVIGASDKIHETINLMQVFLEWTKGVNDITTEINPENPDAGNRVYEMQLLRSGYPVAKRVGIVHQWIATIQIDRVLIAPEEPLAVTEDYTVFAGTDSEWSFGLPADWLNKERISK